MKRVRHVETSPLKHVKIKDDDVVPVNWLVVFLTDTIMGRIAHYLETPVLFQFLLGVCKELRNKATKTTRWNWVMRYQERLENDLNVVFKHDDSQNVLDTFLSRMYTKYICSFCFQLRTEDVLLFRPFSDKLQCCNVCRVNRKLVVTDDDFAGRFVLHPDLLVQVPVRQPWTHEYVGIVPRVHARDDLVLIPYANGKQGSGWFPVVDFDRKRHWATPKPPAARFW